MTFNPAPVPSAIPDGTVPNVAAASALVPPPPPSPEAVEKARQIEAQQQSERFYMATVAPKVVKMLMEAPEAILKAQRAYDAANAEYLACYAGIVIQAFSAKFFPPKKDGETELRAASNDAERDAAVAKLTTTDPTLLKLAAAREEALRNLQFARNHLETAKTVAGILGIK